MASPSPGPGAADVTQETLDAIEEYNDELDADVDRWISSASYIPKDCQYDWRPFCRALIENHRDARSIFPDPPTPPPESDTDQRRRRRGARDVLKGIQPQDEPLGLAPEVGKGWKYVRYVPAWMDPEYKEESLVTPAGRQMNNTVRDAVYNLRPALRLSDEIRRPTDYALRFGIAADRLDGRSRMSPTWSRTRNPLETDFYKQIDSLTEENRQLALKLSLERWKELGKTPTPGLEILPEVIEKLLEQHGLVANMGLANKINEDVGMGRSLDEMVDHIRTVKPGVLEAHRGFLEMLQDDQDYQRVLMGGLTTDELVQNNIHTMSNDVVIDLDNPIHPLFDRNRWDDGWWRGERERTPRYVYNINGTREEYNPVTNDALWEALQPALQLVSMVLAKNNPHLEAIINMNTRQPMPREEGDEDQYPPNLTRYVLEEDIDMSKTYPAIRQLKEVHNYDWKANVFRVLERTLALDIESAYIMGKPYEINESISHDTHRDFIFGICGTYRKYGPNPGAVPPGQSTIKIKIAADIIWPLLVPQYSKSEKMASSFIIASTLLHEFSHAVNQAQELLTTKEYYQLPGQDPEIGRLLESLDGVVWDVHFGEHQEPYYYDEGGEELGYNFEYALWGRSANLTGENEGLSRFHQNLMFVLAEETHPIEAEVWRKGAVQPMIRYMRPIPIDYMAKLFSKRFWEEDFGAYGFSAVRMMPDNYLQKNLLYTPVIPSISMDEALYGKRRAKFMKAVPDILYKSRHYVMAAWLDSLRMEIAYRAQWERWWLIEVGNWEEEILHPLQGSIELLDIEFQTTQDLNMWYLASEQDKVSHYRHWLSTQNTGDPDVMSYTEWQEDVAEKWREMLRYGGWLMQRLLVVHNHMQDDIGNLQRMTFYFLSNKPQTSKLVLKDDNGDYTLAGVLYKRLESFRFHAKRIAGMLNFYTNLAQLRDDKDKWQQWEARFNFNEEQYNVVMNIIQEGGVINSEPFDVSWKARFDRLPTADWKQASAIHMKMALREYARADPAIRKTIDEFIKNYSYLEHVEPLEVTTTVSKIGRALKSMENISPRRPGLDRSSIFDYVPSPQNATGPGDTAVAAQLPQPSQSIPGPTLSSGYTFGVPGGLGMMQNTGIGSRPRRVSRVQKSTGNTQRNTAYRSYVTNLLTTPDPKLVEGAAAELFKSGIPKPILDLLPSQPRVLGRTKRTPIKPFPNPWAGRNVMTSVETAFQEQKGLVDKTIQARKRAQGVYVAPSLWREERGRNDDVDMSDVTDAEA